MGLLSFLSSILNESKPPEKDLYRDAKEAQKQDGTKNVTDNILYTCRDTESFSKNFLFNVNRDCLPGNILTFDDPDSQIGLLQDLSDMNQYIREAKKLAGIRKPYEICVDEISFTGKDKTFIEVCPYTKTGKSAKYPIIVHYKTENFSKFEAPDNYFGDLYYCEDGNIGKARLINWIGKSLMIVHLKTVGRNLVVSKVETLDKNYCTKIAYNRNQN